MEGMKAVREGEVGEVLQQMAGRLSVPGRREHVGLAENGRGIVLACLRGAGRGVRWWAWHGDVLSSVETQTRTWTLTRTHTDRDCGRSVCGCWQLRGGG